MELISSNDNTASRVTRLRLEGCLDFPELFFERISRIRGEGGGGGFSVFIQLDIHGCDFTEMKIKTQHAYF